MDEKKTKIESCLRFLLLQGKIGQTDPDYLLNRSSWSLSHFIRQLNNDCSLYYFDEDDDT